MLGGVDQKAWAQMDSELRVNINDPFVRAEHIIVIMQEAEEEANRIFETSSISKIVKFEDQKVYIRKLVTDF